MHSLAPAELAALRARMSALRAQSGAPTPPDVARHAAQVVVIGSSSRGGSSIFAEVLRSSRRMLHLRAEINPFFRLHGVDDPHSDALAADHPVPPELGRELGWDCGWPTNALSGEADEWRFAVEIAVRLTLQWPDLVFDADTVHGCVQEVLRTLRAEHGWPPGLFADPPHFHARLIARLRAHWPEIQPSAYDLDPRLMAELAPSPAHFVPQRLIEEPPFVLTVPWVVADAERLATHPLVIKTPSNAYRLGWLRRLFGAARLRVLHLTRNVGASVNGLYDGWRYPGFHSHEVGGLDIAGYTGVVPGADRWWKFDRPEGWQAYTRAPLEQVCAFQWRSAHAALIADARAHGPAYRLRFEDALGPAHRQRPALEGLERWLGLPVADELAGILSGKLPVVMATAQPRQRRWFARIGLLAGVLADPQNLSIMEELGYGADPEAWE